MDLETERLVEQVKFLRPYLSAQQLDVTASAAARGTGKDRSNSDKYYFRELLSNLVDKITSAPVTYQQDGIDDPTVHFHYFKGGSDWYISELDVDGGVQQAFGYAILNGDLQNAELGYISITELTENGVELDFHFDKTPLSVIKKSLEDKESAQHKKTPELSFSL